MLPAFPSNPSKYPEMKFKRGLKLPSFLFKEFKNINTVNSITSTNTWYSLMLCFRFFRNYYINIWKESLLRLLILSFSESNYPRISIWSNFLRFGKIWMFVKNIFDYFCLSFIWLYKNISNFLGDLLTFHFYIAFPYFAIHWERLCWDIVLSF